MKVKNILLAKNIIKHKPEIIVDLELTNACNTACIYCPRSKISKRGYISDNTFEKAVQRALELKKKQIISFCGLGEPLLHPDIIKYTHFITKKGGSFRNVGKSE